jgi:hypothetical protein
VTAKRDIGDAVDHPIEDAILARTASPVHEVEDVWDAAMQALAGVTSIEDDIRRVVASLSRDGPTGEV